MTLNASAPAKVLMACIQPYWWSLQLGSQHLARQFARRGCEVHYFSAPVTPLHLLQFKTRLVWQRCHNALHNPVANKNKTIFSHIPFSLIAPDGVPGLRTRPVTQHWHKTLLPPLAGRLARHGLKRVHILYIDNLSYHFLPAAVAYDKCIFRVMDLHDHFPGWCGRTRHMARKLAAQADLTIYSAEGLQSYVAGLEPRKAVLTPNGVDYELFQSTRPAARHQMLQSIPDPVVLYTGIIDIRFDLKLIRHAAALLPHVSFVLVGPCAPGVRLSNLPPNVYLPGPAPHFELPLVMQSARAGLIPFDVNNRMGLIQGIRPLKLLEYLAGGLPVICARWPEVENMGSPAWFYSNVAEFVALVQRALAQKDDPAPFRQYARRHDWANTYKLIMQHIA